MYRFPEGFYTDVREESVHSTMIYIENGVLRQNKTKKERGAIIRLYDGKRWYISSTTDFGRVQAEIDALARMAMPNPGIMEDPVVRQYEANRGENFRYRACDVSGVANDEKQAIARRYYQCLEEFDQLSSRQVTYLDNHTEKHIVSSKGCDVAFDTQNCCVVASYVMIKENMPFYGMKDFYRMRFEELAGHEEEVRAEVRLDLEYNKKAVPVKPGEYTCILSPSTAGVFAHESFGHKSESDFMVADENMKKEWALGTRVGAELLSIVDTGLEEGSGYVPYDDEGTRAKKTYLVKNGVLSGRLHNAVTAAALEEGLTGNARAVSFEFEPIVRMTATYIEPGRETKEELIAGVQEGVYVDNFMHGSGMSTFTIAPRRAYMIRDGKIAEPVKISVLTGNVMKTLHEIDGLSREFELCSFSMGGCGKMEQYPLRVGFGGPYVRVNHITVQ